MRKNTIIKFLIIYFIAKVTGLSYDVFNKEFNFIKLIIDIMIWVIAYFVVDLAFSKLFKKQTE